MSMSTQAREWGRMEDAFRLHAFGTYYTHVYRDERDLTLRFAYALIASSVPIKNRGLVVQWYEGRARRRAEREEAAVAV